MKVKYKFTFSDNTVTKVPIVSESAYTVWRTGAKSPNRKSTTYYQYLSCFEEAKEFGIKKIEALLEKERIKIEELTAKLQILKTLTDEEVKIEE